MKLLKEILANSCHQKQNRVRLTSREK